MKKEHGKNIRHPDGRGAWLGGILLFILVCAACHLRLSQDLSRIVYCTNDGLYTMNIHGRFARELAGGYNPAPVLSPDLSKIAFLSGGSPGAVTVIDFNGRIIGRTIGTDYYSPVWSPDGRRLLMCRTTGNGDVWVMDADGGRLTALAAEADVGETGAVWSPDGSLITYTRYDGLNPVTENDIWIMNADGSGKAPLAAVADEQISPVWSRDGKRLYYLDDRTGTYQIRVINRNGTGDAPRTALPSAALESPLMLSPRGNRLLFRVSPSGSDEQIWTMAVDGTHLERHTPVTDSGRQNRFPAWSPDGLKIAYISSRTGNSEIYVIDLENGVEKRVTTTAALESDLAWAAW